MKKILMLLMAAMLLAACGNDEASDSDSKSETETQKESGYEVELFENEDMKMTLKDKEHTEEDYMKLLTLHAEIENKKDRTFELVIVDLTVDGVEYGLDSVFADNEVGAGTVTDFEFGVFSEEEIKFNEHIKGNIKYMDYEGNVKDVEINKYIND